MTSPSISLRRFVLVSSSLIGWILALSFILNVLYGAKATGGWLIVGIMISAVIYGAYLMTRDLFSAVEAPTPGPRPPRKPAKPAAKPVPQLCKRRKRERRVMARSYRIVLGLGDRRQSFNRRKTGPLTRRSRGEFRTTTLRFNPV